MSKLRGARASPDLDSNDSPVPCAIPHNVTVSLLLDECPNMRPKRGSKNTVSLQLYGMACVTSCATHILAVAVTKQGKNKSPRDNQVGKDALCSVSRLSKTTGRRLEYFYIKKYWKYCGFLIWKDGKARDKVQELGAKPEALQPSAGLRAKVAGDMVDSEETGKASICPAYGLLSRSASSCLSGSRLEQCVGCAPCSAHSLHQAAVSCCRSQGSW